MLTKAQSIFEDIYDLIKVNALSENQNDEWAKLSRRFAEDAKNNLHAYLSQKSISWSPNEIKIGRDITILLKETKNEYK